ncbi:hypothetical protein ACFXK0_21150 [Nocardia sp. NPDC059177]|uniref:hypothetical protein n=1 Tax=Nocardia sp. NPDC059177 TaxID=3346759 RepID=UPI003680F9BE
MNVLLELEQIFAEHDRRASLLAIELDEINAATAERDRRHEEETAPELARLLAEAEAEAEQARLVADQEAAEKARLEAEAQEQRDAIARAAAARRSHNVVSPYDDDDDDPESEYYRRKSWLV